MTLDRSCLPDRSAGPRAARKRLRPAGGYRKTASFQTATIIYDATYWFCEKFLDSRSRTVDQMVQAARSGRQNIAEGSRAAATSSHTELRLLNVARASLEELLLDFEDYLFHRLLPQWAPESAEALAVRGVGQRKAGVISRIRLIRPIRRPAAAPFMPSTPPGSTTPSPRPRQRHHLPDSPGQLPARPADQRAGASVHRGGRLLRAACHRPARPAHAP
jgi:hypothetical protein